MPFCSASSRRVAEIGEDHDVPTPSPWRRGGVAAWRQRPGGPDRASRGAPSELVELPLVLAGRVAFEEGRGDLAFEGGGDFLFEAFGAAGEAFDVALVDEDAGAVLR